MAVTLDNIAARLGVATPDPASPQGKQWDAWIGDAAALVDMRAERFGIDPTTLDPKVVDRVVALAVVAMARNPDDASQVSISVDDASTSRTYRSGSGRVSIVDEWWGWLGLQSDPGAFGTTPFYEQG